MKTVLIIEGDYKGCRAVIEDLLKESLIVCGCGRRVYLSSRSYVYV